jgi:(p)ppGpp synthase/HD superfamily hydrolase
MIEKARLFALAAHGDQKYGDKPYIHHLEAVVEILKALGDEAKIIGYLHDVAEDTPVSIDEIKSEFGDFVGECVAILSDEPGADRKERKIKTYEKMSKVTGKEELALVVKAADRLANIEACLSDGNGSLLAMYKNEHEAFSKAVYRPGLCDDLWDRMKKAIAA